MFTQQNLDDLRNAAYTRQHAEYGRHDQDMRAVEARAIRAGLATVTRRGVAQDYSRWLSGYLSHGGLPTHYHEYPTPTRNLLVATGALTLQPLYGARAVMLIVPVGVKVWGASLGHSSVYQMDGYRHQSCFVPVFSDTKILLTGDN